MKKRGRPRLDITGRRFGRLTAQEPAPDLRRRTWTRSAWWCLCDCGERASVATCDLIEGNTRSCGCLRKENATANPRPRVTVPIGLRIGSLVVEGDATPADNGKSRWLCRCDCGQAKAVRAANLKSGNTTSCGCGRKKS